MKFNKTQTKLINIIKKSKKQELLIQGGRDNDGHYSFISTDNDIINHGKRSKDTLANLEKEGIVSVISHEVINLICDKYSVITLYKLNPQAQWKKAKQKLETKQNLEFRKRAYPWEFK